MLNVRPSRVWLASSVLMCLLILFFVAAPRLLADEPTAQHPDDSIAEPSGAEEYTIYLPAIAGKPPTPTVANTALIPAGEFTRGCNPEVQENCHAGNSDSPHHIVYLDAFRIDKTEVTNKQYAACVAAGNCSAPSSTKARRYLPSGSVDIEYYGVTQYDNYPVIYVSWTQAKAFCAAQGKRLPTAAEWEKAARGNDSRSYPWGNTITTCSQANVLADDSGNDCPPGTPAAVGSYPSGASPYGVLDMSGNVWEWVNDWTGERYPIDRVENPQGPATGTSKFFLGGGYDQVAGNDAVYLRLFGGGVNASYYWVGFRCAYTAN